MAPNRMIPTTVVQIMKYSTGNYVRNCDRTALEYVMKPRDGR